MNKIASIGITLTLTACAYSGVVPMGTDTYMIANSEWGFTSGGYQRAKVTKEASDYCKSIGREFVLISAIGYGVSFGHTPRAEIQFKCL